MSWTISVLSRTKNILSEQKDEAYIIVVHKAGACPTIHLSGALHLTSMQLLIKMYEIKKFNKPGDTIRSDLDFAFLLSECDSIPPFP